MSSVEQKIREVLENVAIEYGEYPSPKTINVDQATQALLQIIESDVIEPIEKGHGGGNWRRLVVQVRANLREDKYNES